MASFHETTCSFLIKHFSCCEVLISFTLFHSHILLRVLHPISKWFHLLSDNTGKIWVETYFQIEIRVKFILTLKVCLGWLPLFTHIEFWWQEKFFYHLYCFWTWTNPLCTRLERKKKDLFDFLCFVFIFIFLLLFF